MNYYGRIILQMSFFLLLSLALYWGDNSQRGPASEPEAKMEGQDENGDQRDQNKVVFLLLDGTNEAIFSDMLKKGELKYFKKYLEPEEDGKVRGIYTPATSVWPSTTGPAYAPFIMGIFPNKSKLSGIRQYFRDTNEFRSYPGSDLSKINDDLNKDYGTIYEFLGEKESYNGQGFVRRRGWKEDGRAMSPSVQNVTSFTGLWNKGLLFGLGKSHVGNDFKNMQTFLAHISPRFDFKMRSYRAFNGLGEDIIDFGPGKVFQSFSNFLERILFKMQGLSHLPRYSFVSLHAPDIASHENGTEDFENENGEVVNSYRRSLRKIDLMFGGMMKYFEMMGYDKKLTVIVSADHGTDTVKKGNEYHDSIVKRLNDEHGIPIKDAPKRITFGFSGDFETERKDFMGVAAVSGNSNVHLYLRNKNCRADCKWSLKERPTYQELRNFRVDTELVKSEKEVDLLSLLATFPQVEQVFAKDREKDRYHIFSLNGESVIHQKMILGKKHFSYQVVDGEDPLKLDSPAAIFMKSNSEAYYTGDEWAQATRDTNYPDSIVQITQLLDAERTGDVVIDAKKGYEPWDEGQAGLHGALRRDHLVVPLYIYSKFLDHEKAQKFLNQLGRYPRTVDVFPTTMELLEEEVKEKITFNRYRTVKWGKRLKRGTQHQKTYKRVPYPVEMPVKTDLDGIPLDLFK